jgi:hypothetical protein
VDVAQVVGRRVQLKKAGRNLKGLCPFHGEKTPSFSVNPDKRMFHCFGCGVSGDAIKFVMQVEGKSFREAVEELARDAGIKLESEDPEEQRRASRRAALAGVNEKACRFFERVLWEHARGAVTSRREGSPRRPRKAGGSGTLRRSGIRWRSRSPDPASTRSSSRRPVSPYRARSGRVSTTGSAAG